MEENYFQAFSDLTKDFIFSKVEDEPTSATLAELHKYRLLALVRQVRNMAVTTFYQMPGFFAASHAQDDWIQEAVIIMFQCCQSYDRRGPFDHFVRFMVSRRLVSMQRKVFSENPPADRDLFKMVQAYKRKNKRLPTADELALETGFDKAAIKKYLESGYGQRTVTTGVETVCQNKAVKVGLSPEKQYMHHEARKILRDCIEKLQPEMKMMFIRHEFDELSFRQLYKQLKMSEPGFSTFKRWYKDNV